MTPNINEVDGKKFYNHTFSFDVGCNLEGLITIKKELIKFLQSKNWNSKNIKIKRNT